MQSSSTSAGIHFAIIIYKREAHLDILAWFGQIHLEINKVKLAFEIACFENNLCGAKSKSRHATEIIYA